MAAVSGRPSVAVSAVPWVAGWGQRSVAA
jgi:hypothetical protein